MAVCKGDLKNQLENCEETNLQLVSDLDECQRRRETELSKMEKDLGSRLKSLADENEQLKRFVDNSRLKISDLSAENAFLNTNLKDAMAKIELYEQQFATHLVQTQTDSNEIKRLTNELVSEKVKIYN